MKARLLGRMGCLGGVAAVCAAIGLAAGAPVASASESCASITGSGSSLQNLAQKNVWSPLWVSEGFKTLFETLECSTGASVTYEPTSSGKGLLEWGANTKKLEPEIAFNKLTLDEFVGTDVAPEGPVGTAGTQIALMDEAGGMTGSNNKVEAIPVAQSAISVIITLPEECTAPADPSVKNSALSKAWLTGAVNFLALVPGTTGSGCDKNALLEARSSGSGTTAGFKRYLNDLEPTLWDKCALVAAEAESQSCWGKVTPDENGNGTGGELAQKVFITAGSMGYADLADARAQGFPKPGTVLGHAVGGKTFSSFIALVPNGGAGASEGTSQDPEGTNEASNCKGAMYPEPTEVKPNEDWSKATQSNSTAGEVGVYPICTLTFDVAWRHYKLVEWENPVSKAKEKYSKEQFSTTFNYLHWVAVEAQNNTTAAQKLAKECYSVLPTEVIKKNESGVVMKNIFWEASGN